MQYGDQGDKHLKARYQNAHLRPMKTMQEDKKNGRSLNKQMQKTKKIGCLAAPDVFADALNKAPDRSSIELKKGMKCIMPMCMYVFIALWTCGTHILDPEPCTTPQYGAVVLLRTNNKQQSIEWESVFMIVDQLTVVAGTAQVASALRRVTMHRASFAAANAPVPTASGCDCEHMHLGLGVPKT